jgi:hypothetical protein
MEAYTNNRYQAILVTLSIEWKRAPLGGFRLAWCIFKLDGIVHHKANFGWLVSLSIEWKPTLKADFGWLVSLLIE